jgi:hypothetical protein
MAKKLPTKNPNEITLDKRHFEAGIKDGFSSDITPSHLVASITTKSLNNAFTVKKFANVNESVEVADYVLELQKAGNEVVGGDLSRLERMLTSQAIALDTIFSRLAIKAANADYMKNYEGFMRLAFKAQAQARSTVEALAVLKHPQPYINQTNIGQVGHKQINMYATTSDHNHIHMQTAAENSKTAPNKLLHEVSV